MGSKSNGKIHLFTEEIFLKTSLTDFRSPFSFSPVSVIQKRKLLNFYVSIRKLLNSFSIEVLFSLKLQSRQ